MLDVYGTTNVDSDVLGVAYYRTQNWPRLIALWKLRVNKPDASATAWFSLAAVYYTANDMANALKTINAVIAKYPNDPETASNGAAAIAQIKKNMAGQ